MKYLKKEINKIYKKESSFLGMDGGNINSDLWFCGVEFGATLNELEKYYSDVVKFYNVNDLHIPYRVDCPDKSMKSYFDRSLAYIYSILICDSGIPEKNKIDHILKEVLYHKDSKIFKLNLFPLAKTEISWDKDFENYLNISKEDYYGLLFENRISFIKELIKQFSPKTILCFSPKGYSEYFIDTFFDDKKNISYLKDSITFENRKKVKVKILNDQNLKVIIIPFLGRGNLNSYDMVREMAIYLKNNYL